MNARKPTAPSPNGPNGERDPSGRFAAGNPGGPGNPYVRRVAELRSALLDVANEADVRALGKALLKQAKAGDVPAAKLVLAYLVGGAPAELRVEVQAPPAEDHADYSRLDEVELNALGALVKKAHGEALDNDDVAGLAALAEHAPESWRPRRRFVHPNDAPRANGT